jgi:hypothetical protein
MVKSPVKSEFLVEKLAAIKKWCELITATAKYAAK